LSETARCIADLPKQFNAAQDLLAHNLSVRPNKTALIDVRGALSYSGLADRVNRMAAAWGSLGIAPGDRVLLCLLDTRDFPTVFLGAILGGVVPVPLNTLQTADDYAWIIENSGAKVVFVTGELADKWADIAAANPAIRFVASEGGPWGDLEAILASATPAPVPAPTRRDDIAFWLYTSGSTGRPKGAMHHHGALRLTANLYGLGCVGYREDDVVLSVAKLFFAYGLGNALTFPMAAGATVILHRDRATPETISALIREHEVSILGGVPTFFAGWLDHPTCPTKADAPRLRFATSAGEALPAHLGEAFHARFGADILDGLGSTEMLHIFVSQRPGAVRYGCSGQVVDGYQVRVAAEDGSDSAVGEIGNLHVRGDSSARKYWNNPDKTAATFRDGWTVTGDKYVADAEGWLTYAGRADDMLKVGGIYVSPIEVEEALSSHAHVLEAAVVGAPDADNLIKPRAHVVLTAGVERSNATEAALKAHVKALLAPYKYPRWILFEDELPKTATGKIQRFKLRATH
jgi:benzoate-CoA ligase